MCCLPCLALSVLPRPALPLPPDHVFTFSFFRKLWMSLELNPTRNRFECFGRLRRRGVGEKKEGAHLNRGSSSELSCYNALELTLSHDISPMHHSTANPKPRRDALCRHQQPAPAKNKRSTLSPKPPNPETANPKTANPKLPRAWALEAPTEAPAERQNGEGGQSLPVYGDCNSGPFCC